MREQCCGVWATGVRCERPGVVVDEARGGWVCHLHAPAGPQQQAAISATIRRAMTRPDRYLAATLAEWTDELLSDELGCSATVVWRLRLMGWPRTDRWETDVQLMAEALQADPRRVTALLRSAVRGQATE